MKKCFSIIMILALLLSISGCGKSGASDYAKERGQIAIEIAEDYLAGNISADTAIGKLSLQESLLNVHIENTEKETDHYPYNDSLVKTYISLCSRAITYNSVGTYSKEYVKDAIKDLKKSIR